MDSAVSTPLTARRGGPLQGRTRVPGDKSISHRALILGALTVGESTVAGLLEGEDVLHTAEAMRALGARLERGADGLWRIHGVGVAGFAQPAGPLDFGNSGTGCRLAIGAVAGNAVTATFVGDASLSNRPMRRVLDPLERMGARVIEAAEGGRLPLTLQGAADPLPIVYESPVPSAQLKSAVLLAGLSAPGETTVIEAEATRDHTERLLKHFGAKLTSKPYGEHGRRITLQGQPELEPANVVVPADPSSAAFPMVAALLVPGSDLILDAVMTNPLRTGLLTTLREMGASIEAVAKRDDGGEEVADLRVVTSKLKGVDVPAERAPAMIDEYPILAVAASFAEGTTRMRGLKELRVKESDRLEATAAMLRANGVTVEIEGDDLIVQGKANVAGGGEVATHMDHRIAMAALVMGLASDNPVRIDDSAFIATSFPGFVELMRALGADLSMIIAIDGPAASGKGTLGKRLAAHYGLRHLDTGLIYRAVAKHVLDAGRRPDDKAAAVAAAKALDPARFDEAALKSHAVGEAASVVSAIPEVRAALLAFQREFAAKPPGAVLDGRDIGTVICPDADVKIYVTATPEVRARRRAAEYQAQGRQIDEATVLADILKRDERDSQRATAPLKQAPDAHLLDTTELDVEAAVLAAIAVVERATLR